MFFHFDVSEAESVFVEGPIQGKYIEFSRGYITEINHDFLMKSVDDYTGAACASLYDGADLIVSHNLTEYTHYT